MQMRIQSRYGEKSARNEVTNNKNTCLIHSLGCNALCTNFADNSAFAKLLFALCSRLCCSAIVSLRHFSCWRHDSIVLATRPHFLHVKIFWRIGWTEWYDSQASYDSENREVFLQKMCINSFVFFNSVRKRDGWKFTNSLSIASANETIVTAPSKYLGIESP